MCWENNKMKTKKFYAFDDKPPIIYRPETSDEAIIQTILVEKKEYLFPRFEPKIIFDIGGNFGAVAVILANIYPKARIYSFEPVKENFELLKENASHYENIYPMPVGLGNKTETRSISPSEDSKNLGGFSTFITAPTVNSDLWQDVDIIDVDIFCKKVGIPDLIKIDCEGAEHEILTAIPDLRSVKWITGELHGVNDYALLGRLERDFRLSFGKGFGDKVWHFHALSKSWSDFGLDQPPQ